MSEPGGIDPAPPRRAVLVAIGTELTEGVILNSHFRFLGSALKGLGYRVVRAVQVPDDRALILAELRRALADAEAVLITGGLGPTSDDLTREAVAAVAGVPLEFREELWQALVARYARQGRRIPATNRKQAEIPRGFEALANAHGSAPGFAGTAEGRFLAALPGPPRELEPMFLQQVAPRLGSAGGAGQLAAGELVGTCLLVPESTLEEVLQRHRRQGVLWGTRVADDRIVFTLRGGLGEEREELFRALRAELGSLRVRPGEEAPAARLFRRLAEARLTVGFAESCTGGLLAKLLTDLPGSSQVFWGAVVAYDEAAKVRLLGVQEAQLARFGAVSRPVAEAMAAGLRARTGVDIAVAATGIAGPEGGSPEVPVGTVWIAADGSPERTGGRQSLLFHFGGDRDAVRRRSAVAGFLLAECVLEGADATALQQGF